MSFGPYPFRLQAPAEQEEAQLAAVVELPLDLVDESFVEPLTDEEAAAS